LIKQIKYLVAGGGPCGIGAALRLQELGENDFLVLEKEDYAGGLATSFVDAQGFTWDVGGHVQFSHYKYFDKIMEKALGKTGWLTHERASFIWMKDRFIPYPLQNNIHRLPEDIFKECFEGLEKALANNSSNSLKNFKDWLLASFGEGIASHFLLPYNYKVWAYHPEKMQYGWIGERVSVVDIERIKKNIEEDKDDISWGPNNTFQFPKFGGTGAIWKSLASMIKPSKISLATEIDTIDSDNNIVTTKNGEKIEYQYLLSTMPLDILCSKISPMPEAISSKSKELLYSSTHIVGIGVEGPTPKHLAKKCWLYFPENNCPFYRVTVFSNYSPNNVPDNNTQYSLMTETSESPDKKVSSDNILQETIDGLIASKLLNPNHKIVSKFYKRFEYGYPTPSLTRDEVLCLCIPYLEKKNIYSRGRFGAWKYEISNQDHTFMQGVEWVNKMINGEQEETFTL
jgi:protoporphyrinogen oxidase